MNHEIIWGFAQLSVFRNKKLTSMIPQIGEKESEALAEQNPAISQAKRRKQMIACLPRLFDMIYFLFQSIKRSVMTKEELMQRVISSHLEITDKSKPSLQFSEACSPFDNFLNLDVSIMQVKLNSNSYYCKNWLLNGFMKNHHLVELSFYCKLPFSNSNHLFALSTSNDELKISMLPAS